MYKVIDESMFIIKNSTVKAKQLLLNEQKLFNLSQEIEETQIDDLIESNMKMTISSFRDMLQLILVGQIILFLCYALIYIPRSYKNYLERNDTTQLMYDTLGYRLQSIARSNIKSPWNNTLLKLAGSNNKIYEAFNTKNVT